MSPSSIAGQFDFRYWCYSGDCSLLTEKHKGVFMVLVNGDMVPPIGSAQGPAKSGSYPPWLLGQPTPIGEGLTAPFSLGFIPGGHGSPVDGRTSVTVEDETLLRSYSDCTKIVNVHLCIDAAYAKEACGAKAQDAINKTVEGMERAVRRYWSVFCPCEEPDTYGPLGCRRRVLIIWHKKCGDAGGGVMPVPLKVRCGSVPGQPTGLTTPDREMDIEAPKGIAAWMDEVYAHEIGHNLLGVPPPGGGDQWDDQGHNLNDPEVPDANKGPFHPLMAPGPRTGRGRVSQKEACLLVALTGGCDKKLCCRPIFGVAHTSVQHGEVSASDQDQRRD